MNFRPRRRPHRPAPTPFVATSPSPELESTIAGSPFTALGVSQPLVRAIVEEGYAQPTPVQSQVIPAALGGRDVLAGAQTGTGKTAAFVIPILQQLALKGGQRQGRVRALVLTPTRELALQIAERVQAYGRHLGLSHVVVYGGVSQHGQVSGLARADVLVATPGRLLDLMQQRLADVGGIEHFVLDEADRMLDMGFIHDVRRITSALPAQRQTMLFSATIPKAIEALARGLLTSPVRVSIEPELRTAERVEQSVIFVQRTEKRAMLERVLRDGAVSRAIVFTRTKHGANRLSEQLHRAGIGATAIHGNKSQGARQRALEAFRQGSMRVLVATDVAARGIDVDGISHVINFDLPNVAESYVHRIGRTGRAGAAGRAISFCAHEERGLLADIERFIQRRLPAHPSPTL